MTKHIIKIRTYRVFKKDGLHYVKINNKKYISDMVIKQKYQDMEISK